MDSVLDEYVLDSELEDDAEDAGGVGTITAIRNGENRTKPAIWKLTENFETESNE